MNIYNARDLLRMSEEELWALPPERHTVIFADGELVTHTRATIASVYLWHALSEYPECPIFKEYHLGDTRFTSKNMLVFINRVIWGIHAWSGETVDTERLSHLAILTTNRFYNVFTIRLSAYVTGMSMFDVLDVATHPAIAAITANIEPTQHGIEEVAYPAANKVWKDLDILRGNPIAEGVRCGTQKIDQVNQCFIARGFPTDYNSDIFPEAITANYVDGIWDLYGSMTESRSGTKALAFNKELLRITEYFNRKTQLVCQNVMNLHHTDCGTPHYVDFPVLESVLPRLKGKYYRKEDGSVDWLRGNEKHLIGTKIKMRSILSCIHPDPSGVCAKCYGRLAYSIPHGTNIGQVSAVIMGDKITSSVLSTKHTDATSVIDRYHLHKVEAKYLRYGTQEETLYLRKELKGRKMRLVVERDEVHSLADVLMLTDLSAYPVTHASHLTKIGIQMESAEGTTSEVLNVSLYNRKSSFSKELLEYIQKVRWTHDSRDNVVIDLQGFDTTKPFLVLPYKHVNMYEVMKRIQSFLHSGTDSDGVRLSTDKSLTTSAKTYLKNYKDPVEALAVFTAMINEKLTVNVLHCEILVYAMMVRSTIQRDYRLPIPGISGMFEKFNKLMMNRSLGVAMAFEKQHDPLISPGSFLYKQRNDHPYDLIMLGGKLD
jgi:hypothetical protein